LSYTLFFTLQVFCVYAAITLLMLYVVDASFWSGIWSWWHKAFCHRQTNVVASSFPTERHT